MKSKLKSVVYLAQLTPSSIKSETIQPLIEEWKQLAIEDGIESHEEEQLDVYWERIFEMRKFRLIKSFVTTLLCIQPYNAAEERGFSVNSSVVTKERNRLQPEALNSIRRVRSHLHNFGGLQNFEVTQPLIDLPDHLLDGMHIVIKMIVIVIRNRSILVINLICFKVRV